MLGSCAGWMENVNVPRQQVHDGEALEISEGGGKDRRGEARMDSWEFERMTCR